MPKGALHGTHETEWFWVPTASFGPAGGFPPTNSILDPRKKTNRGSTTMPCVLPPGRLAWQAASFNRIGLDLQKSVLKMYLRGCAFEGTPFSAWFKGQPVESRNPFVGRPDFDEYPDKRQDDRQTETLVGGGGGLYHSLTATFSRQLGSPSPPQKKEEEEQEEEEEEEEEDKQ